MRGDLLPYLLQCAVFVLCVLVCPGLPQYYWAEWRYIGGTLSLEFWRRLAQALAVTAIVAGIGGWALVTRFIRWAEAWWNTKRHALWEAMPETKELRRTLRLYVHTVNTGREERAKMRATIDTHMQGLLACWMEEGLGDQVGVYKCCGRVSGFSVGGRHACFNVIRSGDWLRMPWLNQLREQLRAMQRAVETATA